MCTNNVYLRINLLMLCSYTEELTISIMSFAAALPIDTSHLDDQLDERFDYTKGKAVVDTLITIITCLIQQETSNMLVLFNDQCYGLLDFYRHKKEEYRKSRRREDSGMTNCLLDP